MKKQLFAGLAVGLMLLGMAGVAESALVTFGTAGYDSDNDGTIENSAGYSEYYNLIYDNDDNLIWLDYAHDPKNWNDQNAWASGLSTGSTLNIMIDSGYDVTWGSNDNWGLAGLSEFTALYSEKIALGYAGNFENLIESFYWSDTGHSSNGLMFNMWKGYSGYHGATGNYYGLAVRSGQVTYTDPNTSSAPVPEPATMLLMGTGLAGLIGARRKKKA